MVGCKSRYEERGGVVGHTEEGMRVADEPQRVGAASDESGRLDSEVRAADLEACVGSSHLERGRLNPAGLGGNLPHSERHRLYVDFQVLCSGRRANGSECDERGILHFESVAEIESLDAPRRV